MGDIMTKAFNLTFYHCGYLFIYYNILFFLIIKLEKASARVKLTKQKSLDLEELKYILCFEKFICSISVFAKLRLRFYDQRI